MHGKDEKCIQNFGQKTQMKNPLVRQRCRWEDNIRMDLRDTGWGSMDWIHLPQDRNQWQALVNMVTNLQVP
jgi:hypothetical protein